MALKGKLFMAGPYDEHTVAMIKDRFEKLHGESIAFDVQRDDTLIGGFRAMLDGKLYDSSMLTRLETMQQCLFATPEQDE